MYPGGQNLRVLREQLGLTMRDVETATLRIADKHGNEEFSIPPSRLSDIETKGLVPSVFRLYSLAIVYRRDFRDPQGSSRSPCFEKALLLQTPPDPGLDRWAIARR